MAVKDNATDDFGTSSGIQGLGSLIENTRSMIKETTPSDQASSSFNAFKQGHDGAVADVGKTASKTLERVISGMADGNPGAEAGQPKVASATGGTLDATTSGVIREAAEVAKNADGPVTININIDGDGAGKTPVAGGPDKPGITGITGITGISGIGSGANGPLKVDSPSADDGKGKDDGNPLFKVGELASQIVNEAKEYSRTNPNWVMSVADTRRQLADAPDSASQQDEAEASIA